MNLTERDQSLLLDLKEYALLRTRTVRDRHFSGVAMTTVLRRLRRLEGEGYIQRIEGLPTAQVAWALTDKSAERLLPRASKIHFPRFILDHDLNLTDLRLLLEAHGIARSWKPEHEIRSRVAQTQGLRRTGDRNIPDGLMGVEIRGEPRTVAIEMELTAKSQDRYRRILGDYHSKRSLWGVWYIVHRHTIGRQIDRAAKGSGYFGRQPYILWSMLDEVMRNPLEAAVYGDQRKYLVCDLWSLRPPPEKPSQLKALEMLI